MNAAQGSFNVRGKHGTYPLARLMMPHMRLSLLRLLIQLPDSNARMRALAEMDDVNLALKLSPLRHEPRDVIEALRTGSDHPIVRFWSNEAQSREFLQLAMFLHVQMYRATGNGSAQLPRALLGPLGCAQVDARTGRAHRGSMAEWFRVTWVMRMRGLYGTDMYRESAVLGLAAELHAVSRKRASVTALAMGEWAAAAASADEAAMWRKLNRTRQQQSIAIEAAREVWPLIVRASTTLAPKYDWMFCETRQNDLPANRAELEWKEHPAPTPAVLAHSPQTLWMHVVGDRDHLSVYGSATCIVPTLSQLVLWRMLQEKVLAIDDGILVEDPEWSPERRILYCFPPPSK